MDEEKKKSLALNKHSINVKFRIFARYTSFYDI